MTDEDNRGRLADNFNRSHTDRLKSEVAKRLYQKAYGNEYLEEINPSGFYSRTTLRRLLDALHLEQGKILLDLGCGHGGSGLWAIQQTGADLIGIDISTAGLALAESKANSLGLTERSRFQVGEFISTGLPDASCDAVMSLDVFLYLPDKPAGAKEVARILRPGGRFGFTTWEQEGFSERLNAPQVEDHRPLLEEAGFEVKLYEEPPNWREQQCVLLEGIIEAEAELLEERGPEAGERYVNMARGAYSDLPQRKYILVVAQHG